MHTNEIVLNDYYLLETSEFIQTRIVQFVNVPDNTLLVYVFI